MMAEAKTLCATPTPGKQPTAILSWKYDAVRRAILELLPAQAPGIPFKELPGMVARCLSAEQLQKLGSVTWYTTTVKLDLEVKGEIQRLPGITPQALIRTI